MPEPKSCGDIKAEVKNVSCHSPLFPWTGCAQAPVTGGMSPPHSPVATGRRIGQKSRGFPGFPGNQTDGRAENMEPQQPLPVASSGPQVASAVQRAEGTGGETACD